MKKWRIVVFGAGAMGSFIAAKLRFRLPASVTVGLVTSRHSIVDKFLLNGITIRSSENEINVPVSKQDSRKLLICSNYLELVTGNSFEKYDLAIMMTKGCVETKCAVQNAIQLLENEGSILTLQNGIGYFNLIKSICHFNRHLKPVHVYAGTTSMGIRMETTDDRVALYQASLQGLTTVANCHGYPSLNIDDIKYILEACDMVVTTKPADEVEAVLWNKLVVSASLNPVCVLMNNHNGYIFEAEDATFVNLLGEAIAEVLGIAIKKGITLDFTSSAKLLTANSDASNAISRCILKLSENTWKKLVEIPQGVEALNHVLWVAFSTYKNVNSMLADVRSKRRTECESILQPLIELAKSNGIQCETLQRFVSYLKEHDDSI